MNFASEYNALPEEKRHQRLLAEFERTVLWGTVLHSFIGKVFVPMLKRIDELEQRVKDLERCADERTR